MKVSHNWLTEYLGDTTPTAEKIAELLTFHSFEIDGVETVGDDQVIDVDVLPNRGADCLCHRGIAREIATLLDVELAHDPLRVDTNMPHTDELAVTIENSEACRHFDLALIKGVQVKESPEWLKRRLAAIGQRSINNVVDATNYVMFSLGQPTHVYDADKFAKEGNRWHFGVRMAKAGEVVTTLGGEEHELDETIQVITNEADGSYAGIAGIKGGAYAELGETTTTIILEAGNFAPHVTRKASQKLKLQTDASKRFENGVSTNVIPYAITELARLVTDIAGGELVGFAHSRPVDIENTSVSVSLTHSNALLGLTLGHAEVEDIFRRLGFTFEAKATDEWVVTAPFERTDIVIAEDVIEEVGRVYGYDNVTSVVPEAVPLTEYNQRHIYSELIRDVLIEHGFSEVITSSFRKKDTIQLQNALASDKSCLRSSLTKNITETLDKNAPLIDLLGVNDSRVFEIGTVFDKTVDSVTEHFSLAFGVRLKASGYTGKEDKVIADILQVLENTLQVKPAATIEKGVAEIDLTQLLTMLPAVREYKAMIPSGDVAYQPFSMYPHMSRDIAMWVGEGIAASEIAGVLNETAGPLRVRTTLFDEFTKDGRTSFAFRLVFQSYEKTLTDEEVNTIMDGVYTAVSERGWEVR